MTTYLLLADYLHYSTPPPVEFSGGAWRRNIPSKTIFRRVAPKYPPKMFFRRDPPKNTPPKLFSALRAEIYPTKIFFGAARRNIPHKK